MNLSELLSSLNIPHQTAGKHARSGWVQIDCPDCGPGSGKFHLGVNERYLNAHCWKCGSKNLVGVLSGLARVPYQIIKDALKDVPRWAIPKAEPRGKLSIPKGIEPMGDIHRRYLRDRGFDPEEIESVWGVKGIGVGAKLRWRIFIPIFIGSDMVSWTTRSINPNAAQRYISASPSEESISHKKILYGEHLAGHSVVVVEGPADAWKLGPGTIATLGTSFCGEQVDRIRQYPKRAVCYDNSIAAQKRAKELCGKLSLYPGETHWIRIDADDPATCSKKEVRLIRKNFLR